MLQAPTLLAIQLLQKAWMLSPCHGKWTTAPTPSLTNIVQAACLNATADEDENTAGLQYSVQINTGREQNDTVTARMVLDGIEIATQQAQTDTVDFAGRPSLRAHIAILL